jgi:hypothetical protein
VQRLGGPGSTRQIRLISEPYRVVGDVSSRPLRSPRRHKLDGKRQTSAESFGRVCVLSCLHHIGVVREFQHQDRELLDHRNSAFRNHRLSAILLTRGEAHDCPVADRLICPVQRAKRMLRRLKPGRPPFDVIDDKSGAGRRSVNIIKDPDHALSLGAAAWLCHPIIDFPRFRHCMLRSKAARALTSQPPHKPA